MKWPRLRSRLRTIVCSANLLLISLVSISAYGQLPNQSKSSPLNYLARFHGIGYSDGYHSCPNNQCGPSRSWARPASFSSFYEEPTTPVGSRFYKPAPSYSVHQSYGHVAEPIMYAPTAQPGPPPSAMQMGPVPIGQPTPDHSSAIPGNSILMQNEPAMGVPAGLVNPGQADPWGPGSSELIPPPQPTRGPSHTRRSIPGTTRPYHATLPSGRIVR